LMITKKGPVERKLPKKRTNLGNTVIKSRETNMVRIKVPPLGRRRKGNLPTFFSGKGGRKLKKKKRPL